MSKESQRDRDDEEEESSPQSQWGPRRRFLAGMTIGIGGLIGVFAGVPLVAMLLSPLQRRRRPRWVAVGEADTFVPGHTVKVTYREPGALPWAGDASRSAAWLRRGPDGEFLALSAYCTHVGCPTRWSDRASLFLCPCHGGAFFPDGAVAAGPPPRPLPVLPVRVREGQVEILPQPLAATATV